MAIADDQRADDEHEEHVEHGENRATAERRLSLAGQLAPDGSLGQIWSVPKAMVYYTLQQLELLGLIRMTGEFQASRGRARSVCEITPAGRVAAGSRRRRA